VIDLHTHVLPGIDDGCRTLEESVDLVRAAAADGITALAATPHVRSDYPTTPETMERLVGEVREAVAAAGIPVEILTGGEISLDRLDALSGEELDRFGLGGNPKVVLLEFPYSGWPLALDGVVFRLQTQGRTVVLAHPERNREVQSRADALEELVARGVLVQVTAASLDGRLGGSSRRAARELLDRGLVHLVASDAHEPRVRAAGLRRAAAALGDDTLARWLTDDMPRALAAAGRLPERPVVVRRRRLGWLARS
jgi:protein-tyrosine phosphatase